MGEGRFLFWERLFLWFLHLSVSVVICKPFLLHSDSYYRDEQYFYDWLIQQGV